jgi:hypothetical protein
VSKYIYIAQVSIAPEKEKAFNELYDSEHLPYVLEVPGVLSGRRFKLEWADTDEMPQYLAIYELDDPNLPKTDAWKIAADKGAWRKTIGPYMTVRRHGMFRKLDE